MPIYEYVCKGCGHEFEVMQRITDPPLQKCQVCGGQVRRIISHTSFILKGSGWYATDYPSESRKKAMKPDNGGKEGSGPPTDGGSKNGGKDSSRETKAVSSSESKSGKTSS